MTTSTSSDEWAIRQLVERYASAADHADGAAAATVFTADAELEVWLDPAHAEPTGVRRGRTEIAAAIATLRRYDATLHEIANSTAAIAGDRAHGVTHCAAHHVSADESGRSDKVLFIRYDDSFVRADGQWLIARRELHVKWTSRQPVEPT